jgi:hypothetical protein
MSYLLLQSLLTHTFLCTYNIVIRKHFIFFVLLKHNFYWNSQLTDLNLERVLKGRDR